MPIESARPCDSSQRTTTNDIAVIRAKEARNIVLVRIDVLDVGNIETRSCRLTSKLTCLPAYGTVVAAARTVTEAGRASAAHC